MAPPAATGEAKDLKGGRGNDNREQASNSTGYGSSSCMRAAFLCLLVPASGNGSDLDGLLTDRGTGDEGRSRA